MVNEVAFLQDLHLWGARRALPSTFVGVNQPRLERRGYVRFQDTALGSVVLLGRQGRHVLGLDPNYVSPPHAACNQLLVRAGKDRLEDKGYVYHGRLTRNLSRFTLIHPIYLTGIYPSFSRRALRRLIETHRSTLFKENAKIALAVASDGYQPVRGDLLSFIHILEVDVRKIRQEEVP